MGSVYRREYKVNGKKVKSEIYTLAYYDEAGQRRTVKGYRDKRASEEKLRRLEDRAARLKEGLPVSNAIQARNFLEAAAAYRDDLKRLGRSRATWSRAVTDLERIASWCRWKTIQDIRGDRMTEYLAHLANRPPVVNPKCHRVCGPAAPHTINAYRDILCRFCDWCVGMGWLAVNPVSKVTRCSAGTPGDTRFRPMARRALTVDEFLTLTSCPEILPWRRDLYVIAGLSGLRANELRQITTEDFTLGKHPRWHLRPQITKAGRLDTVPMLPECAAALDRLVNGLPQHAKLFPRRPNPLTVQNDYTKAKVLKRDHRGRRATFHSLRYFFCTLTGRTLPIQTVRLLMRHATIKMTCDVYMDLGLDDVAEQARSLPPLFTDAAQRARPGAAS